MLLLWIGFYMLQTCWDERLVDSYICCDYAPEKEESTTDIHYAEKTSFARREPDKTKWTLTITTSQYKQFNFKFTVTSVSIAYSNFRSFPVTFMKKADYYIR